MAGWNHRRLCATSAAGLGSSAFSVSGGAPIGPEAEAARPASKTDLPTPALLVDLDRFQANIEKRAEHCRAGGCALRPHARTHKCPEVARRQMAAGA